MLQAAIKNGWLNGNKVIMKAYTASKEQDVMVLTYFAPIAYKELNN